MRQNIGKPQPMAGNDPNNMILSAAYRRWRNKKRKTTQRPTFSRPPNPRI